MMKLLQLFIVLLVVSYNLGFVKIHRSKKHITKSQNDSQNGRSTNDYR